MITASDELNFVSSRFSLALAAASAITASIALFILISEGAANAMASSMDSSSQPDSIAAPLFSTSASLVG